MSAACMFISHISSETELAQLLKRQIGQDFGNILDIFVSSDKKSIQAGDLWLTELSQALEAAQFLLVLCSKESIGRPWVNFEAGAGWVRGIPVIPICHSEFLPTQLPVPLSMLQAVRASQVNDLRSLYETIANRLNVPAPTPDLVAFAAQIEEVEQRYIDAARAQNRIEKPRILCGASDEYAQPALGFDGDVAALEAAFPGQVRVERKLTSKLLRQLLTSQQFDIIHLVMAVDPTNGDLFFDPIFGKLPAPGERIDRMKAAAFADFVQTSGARLVVLNTCQALFLAARVAPVANMVATHVEITGQVAASWAEYFYDLVAEGFPLYKAYELTFDSVPDAPMALIRHRDFSVAPRAQRPELAVTQVI